MRRSIDRLGVPTTYPWYESKLPYISFMLWYFVLQGYFLYFMIYVRDHRYTKNSKKDMYESKL